MTYAAYVFLGGGIGSVLRYLVAASFGGLWGTLIVNLLGSFMVGYVAEKFEAREPLRMFLIAGVLGGFTTFSAFSLETMRLGSLPKSLGYIVVSVLGACVLCMLGQYLAGQMRA